MKKLRVIIKGTSLPMRSPILAGMVWWLMMDRLDASMWLYGVICTLWTIIFAAYLFELHTTESRDAPGFGKKEA